MKMSAHKRKKQSGASMVETMIALVLMCLLFFGAMNIFLWVMTRMFCDYSAFYATKAFSLGYAAQTIRKAAYIAAIPISGKDENNLLKQERNDLGDRLRLYMSTGNAGVDFPHWHNNRYGNCNCNNTCLNVVYPSVKEGEPTYFSGRVKLRNTTYLSEIRKLFFMKNSSKNQDISGKSYSINHSKAWMESRGGE